MSKRQGDGLVSDSSAKRQKTVIQTSDSEESEDEENQNDETDNSVVESSLISSQLCDKKEPVVGVIRRISMSNFMCHNRLEVNLGSHVNFIVGRNGSGKSAILTALVVGLGGKATVTSRGSSIKNFIKSGKRSAWVEVSLSNKGKDGYKPHQYGDKIVIKRRFSIDGSSSYGIYSATGQFISARRDELSRILDHFNIQVDNPVSILNQDSSRNFLNTKSAGDKFKFFMKATQLEQMNSDYAQVRRNKEDTRLLIMSKEQTLPKMKLEVKVWENKFKNLTALSDLKEKVKHLRQELAWALVAEKEKGLKPLEKSLLVEEAAQPRFVEKVDQAKAQVEEWEARHKEVEQRLIDCGKEVKDLEPLLQQKKEELLKAKNNLTPIMNQLKACDRELRSTRQECQQCEDRIEELKTMASSDFEADRRQREEQIEDLKKKLEETMNKQKVKEHEIEQFRSAVAKYKTDVAHLDAQLKAKNNKLKDVKTTERTLQSAQSDRLQRFGHWMPAIVRQIQAKKRMFHKLPLGPLGACFDLTDPKWALAVECCLKALVSAFVCTDHHDEKILEEIFHQNPECPRSRRPAIITCLFTGEVHDISKFKVKTNRYKCLLDVIKCDNPVIINTLIDQRSVENVLLIEDSTEAQNVMMRSPPANARECFTIEGDQAFSQPTFRYYSSDKTSVKFLMADVKDQIMKLQQEMKVLDEEARELAQKKDNQQREIAKNQHEEKACLSQLNKMAEHVSGYKFEINELENVEDPASVDVTTLEEEVTTYKQKIEELLAKQTSIQELKSAREDNLNAVKESYSRVEADIRERSDNGIPLREEISQAQAEVDNARQRRKHYSGKLKEQEKKIEELKKQVERYRKDVEEDRQKARQICHPIQSQRPANSVEAEITQIEHRISEEEQQQGNEEEITETYNMKKTTLERVRSEVRQLKKYIERLDEAVDKRRVAYMKMRKNIAGRTKFYFLVQMFQRSFTGKMNFDFEKQTLEILVNTSPDTQDGQSGISASKDLKSLSGGERSFSTVCFILSLWEAMESPFRCLDEFDVFMDMVNRRISMDMMMETADMHKDMQFIFLTPQDMSSVRKISNVKIYRMQDPERSQNQSTLPFSQSSQSE